MSDEPRDAILDAHAALIADGTIEPLSRDPGEVRRWLDCELASLAAGRFFVDLDPQVLTEEDRARWEPRATSEEPLSDPHGQDWYRVPYWIVDGGERAGTIALGTTYMGPRLVTVSSLYTLPSRRGRGVAGRALRRAQEAVVAQGGWGLRVPAYWTWQASVRFYLGLGMWIANWKHAVVFCWRRDLPVPRVEVGEREARFGLMGGGGGDGGGGAGCGMDPLIVARREGDRLGWEELPRLREVREEAPGVFYAAAQTFAVSLAVHGWPLIRSAEAWEARYASSDGGGPEGLAYKIALWEAWDRKCGWEVRTPRIPGLAYPEWEAFG